MPGFECVHHIEIGAVDGPATVELLRGKFTFSVRATRSTPVVDQWLLVKNNTRFLVTSLKNADQARLQADDYAINWTSHQTSNGSKLPTKDSVFNVAFQVKDLTASFKRLESQQVVVSKPLRTVRDSGGSVEAVTVKSCVGDIHHTLVHKGDYSGCFLPGFTPVEEDGRAEELHPPSVAMETFDHVAISVEMGTSISVIDWYERCFGMRRFLINGEEDDEQGLVLSTKDVGLRLRAMEYWKCAEVGLLTPGDETVGEDGTSRLSMVVAEGLPPFPGSTEENQIEAWLRQHGGPGIQHVAIASSDIKSTVYSLKRAGAEFAKPPPLAYYSEVGRLHDIIKAGEDVESLKQNGILIDTEADAIQVSSCSQDTDITNRNKTYLLQVFTKPMLQSDPFFLEIIQREGASGFGSGNVSALYRSVQAFIVDDPQRQRV